MIPFLLPPDPPAIVAAVPDIFASTWHWTSTYTAPGELFACANHGTLPTFNVLHVRIIWGNTSGGLTWNTSTEEPLIRNYLNNVSSDVSFQIVNNYVGHTLMMSVANECTCTQSSGFWSSLSTITCASGWAAACSCGFPVDTADGFDLLIMRDPAIGPSVSGCSAGATNAWNGALITAKNATSTTPTPNGNNIVDSAVNTIKHEIFEQLADPFAGGWHCADNNAAPGQIGDMCEQSYGSDAIGATGSGPFNDYVNGSPYYTQDLWQAAPINGCVHSPQPKSAYWGAACKVDSDCPKQGTWQLACVAGQCGVPTCFDGKKNGNESDIDCGGSCAGYLGTIGGVWTAHTCPSGKACNYGPDCASYICTGGVCQ